MTLPALTQTALEWIQAASWVAAVATALFGIIKIVIELRQAREQRAQELRWRKAQAAKTLNDQMLADHAALAAMIMLDWDGREFEIKPGVKAAISTEEMLHSLRTVNTTFSDTEAFVRDSFDLLLYYLGMFEHYISRRLVDYEDLVHPIEYYVGLMAANRPVFEKYFERYGFTRAAAFLGRFGSWQAAGAAGHASSGTARQPSGSAGGGRIISDPPPA